MMRIVAALAAVLVGALTAVAPALSSSADGRQLHAQFATGTDCTNKSLFSIDLTEDGRPVTSLRPGTYWLTVNDTCPNHDFHLIGPGVDEVVTTVPQVGVVTVKVHLDHGVYRLRCDPHWQTFGMYVDFAVGGVGQVNAT